MKIIGLDLSLTSTGFAHDLGTGTLQPAKGYERGTKRLQWIRARVFELAYPNMNEGDDVAADGMADLVAIEGYSFSSMSSHAHALGELGGVIRCALTDVGIRYVDISPKSLKLFATGSGAAKKEDMLGAAIRKLSYPGNQNDEVDALWLFTMASTYYQGTASNDAQRRALAGVSWPTLT